MKRAKASSKFDLRALSEPGVALAARKSKASSRSAALLEAVPPRRIIAPVIWATPGFSSMCVPGRNEKETLMSGNSFEGIM
jgi:hypothetical protein